MNEPYRISRLHHYPDGGAMSGLGYAWIIVLL
jgi:hypothetical protein